MVLLDGIFLAGNHKSIEPIGDGNSSRSRNFITLSTLIKTLTYNHVPVIAERSVRRVNHSHS